MEIREKQQELTGRGGGVSVESDVEDSIFGILVIPAHNWAQKVCSVKKIPPVKIDSMVSRTFASVK